MDIRYTASEKGRLYVTAQIFMLPTLSGQTSGKHTCTVKPVLSDHIKQDMFLTFQTGGCLLLHESSAESCRSFLHYFQQ